jgi:hypothetical protein
MAARVRNAPSPSTPRTRARPARSAAAIRSGKPRSAASATGTSGSALPKTARVSEFVSFHSSRMGPVHHGRRRASVRGLFPRGHARARIGRCARSSCIARGIRTPRVGLGVSTPAVRVAYRGALASTSCLLVRHAAEPWDDAQRLRARRRHTGRFSRGPGSLSRHVRSEGRDACLRRCPPELLERQRLHERWRILSVRLLPRGVETLRPRSEREARRARVPPGQGGHALRLSLHGSTRTSLRRRPMHDRHALIRHSPALGAGARHLVHGREHHRVRERLW